ncbi:MAG: hypothetical protein KDA21_09125 [Phycisphaerales bacterium]|nr:hypothetical protein [Phycisphaerales bacterium]
MFRITLMLVTLLTVLAAPLRGAAPEWETVGDLLTALETAGGELQTLAADVYWADTSFLNGDTTVREGRFYFTQGQAELDGFRPRTFAAHFTVLIVDGRRFADTYDQRFVFDGAWFTQIRDKQDDRYYERRRVAPPGQRIDPLRLGQGPMPIPIGQSRESIEERFEAELLEPLEGVEDLTGDVFALGWENAVQLRLTPRPDYAPTADFREVRLWYDRDTLLPRMARTTRRQGGDDSVLVLYNVERNVEIPAAVMDVTEPPDGQGWDKNIKDDRVEPAPPPPSGAQGANS